MELCEQVHKQLLEECKEMMHYALSKGLAVPDKVLKMLEPVCQVHGDLSGARTLTTTQLGIAHEQLSKSILPASPGALCYLRKHSRSHSKSLLRFLGPIPLVRYLIIAALVSLVTMLGLSLIPGLDGHLDWMHGAGAALLAEELFLLAAAGLGASFAALFKASQYVTNRTFDPQYINTYWLRFVLGLIAGMVLAMLISPPDAANTAGTEGTASLSADIAYFTKPLLAMLGGFSASGVYRILSRLVQAFETLVTGEASADEQLLTQRRLLDAERTQERAAMAARLANLRRHGSAETEGELDQGLDQIIAELTGETVDSDS